MASTITIANITRNGKVLFTVIFVMFATFGKKSFAVVLVLLP